MKQPKLHVIIDEVGLALAEAALDTYTSFTTYDCETTGVHHGCTVVGFSFCGADNEAWYIVLEKWDVASQTLLPVLKGHPAIQRILLKLKARQLVMHNGVFDAAVAEQFFKVCLIDSLHTCTMTLAHLLDENETIGLKDLGERKLGIDASKEAREMEASVLANGGQYTKKNKEMFKADWRLLGKYGAKDAWMTYMLFFILVDELYEQKLDKFFYEDESMPLLRGPTYELNTTGLKVDAEKLSAVGKALQAEALEAKDFVYTEIATHIKQKYPGTSKKTTFNIGSSQQLSWLMFGKLELEFNTLTKGGKTIARHLINKLPYSFSDKRYFIHVCLQSVGEVYEPEAIVNGKKKKAKKIKEPWGYIQCDKKTLTKYKDKFKWVAKLLEYQKKTKLYNTYVKGIEQRMQYGIIRPSFLQTGTTGGRYSSRNPNFQNLPRDDKRIKACIVARPGKIFVGADYSQLEPRVFAYFSKDERLLDCFKKGYDFYSVVGAETYNKPECTLFKDGNSRSFEKQYPDLRQDTKTFTLASTYGKIGRSDKELEDVERYFEAFPSVKQMMLDSHAMAKKDGQVTNLFGRPRRMPEATRINKIYGDIPHAELPYEARTVLNLAVNHRIQSTGASIINRAMIAFFNMAKEAGIDCKIVLQVHDSLAIECQVEDAEDVSLLLKEAMENTVDLKTVRLEAEPKKGTDLSQAA